LVKGTLVNCPQTLTLNTNLMAHYEFTNHFSASLISITD